MRTLVVGYKDIKNDLKSLVNFLKVEKLRSERGFSQTPVSLHSVFMGPPGTGKTTIARLIGKVYHALGFLSKGHIIETDRAGMVGGYVGHTAIKVDTLVNQALDGILFIDEAYALRREGTSSNDFGQEAIDTLLKRMEDHRSRLVVIVAGYSDEMTLFIEANPGLKSRFTKYFSFVDYTPHEMFEIFYRYASKSKFKLTTSANKKILDRLSELYKIKDRTFGNGRLVRNIFEKTLELQASRLVTVIPISDELLQTITDDDIPNV
jgi:SpoVK/Ycf46/Vps4 family AAA+-type ATPase